VRCRAGTASPYDEETLRRLASMRAGFNTGSAVPPVKNPQKAKAIRKLGQEPMREALYHMSALTSPLLTPSVWERSKWC
jgi:hypothetical protein